MQKRTMHYRYLYQQITACKDENYSNENRVHFYLNFETAINRRLFFRS